MPVSDAFRFVELERDKSNPREKEFMDLIMRSQNLRKHMMGSHML